MSLSRTRINYLSPNNWILHSIEKDQTTSTQRRNLSERSKVQNRANYMTWFIECSKPGKLIFDDRSQNSGYLLVSNEQKWWRDFWMLTIFYNLISVRVTEVCSLCKNLSSYTWSVSVFNILLNCTFFLLWYHAYFIAIIL